MKRQIAKCRITKLWHTFVKKITLNDKMSNLMFPTNSSSNIKMTPASQPGVIPCLLRSQTFTCTFLYYCLSLHVIKMPLTLFSTFCDSTFFLLYKKVQNVENKVFQRLFWHFYIRRFVTFLAFFWHFVIRRFPYKLKTLTWRRKHSAQFPIFFLIKNFQGKYLLEVWQLGF